MLVSIGHSDATAAQAEAAADAGARLVTHLFNAMRPLHHREPGMVGQALADPRLACGLIADLHHVAAPVCRLAFAAAAGRVVLVTDAVAAAGMPPGTYDLGGQQVSVDPLGLPRRADGTLAGSGLRLDAAVANVVAAGVDLRSAVDAATRLPADLVGRPDLGRIAPGRGGRPGLARRRPVHPGDLDRRRAGARHPAAGVGQPGPGWPAGQRAGGRPAPRPGRPWAADGAVDGPASGRVAAAAQRRAGPAVTTTVPAPPGAGSWMAAEIREQPAALRRTLDALLPRVPEVAALAARTRQVLFIARGSSDAAAHYGRYLCEVGAGRLATPASPSVATLYRRRLDLAGVLAVALSQSGRTEEIVETLDWARDCGAAHGRDHQRRRQPAGRGRGAGAGHRGRPGAGAAGHQDVHGPAGRAGGARARASARTRALRVGAAAGAGRGGGRAATPRPPPTELAAALSDVDGLVVSGRGFASSTAWELSLKVRETCAIDASGLSYADLLHGPIAVVGAAHAGAAGGRRATARCCPACSRWPSGCGRPARRSTASAAARRWPRPARRRCPARTCPSRWRRWRWWCPGQLAAEALSRRLGLDPDAPGGLAKVTQTDGGARR